MGFSVFVSLSLSIYIISLNHDSSACKYYFHQINRFNNSIIGEGIINIHGEITYDMIFIEKYYWWCFQRCWEIVLRTIRAGSVDWTRRNLPRDFTVNRCISKNNTIRIIVSLLNVILFWIMNHVLLCCVISRNNLLISESIVKLINHYNFIKINCYIVHLY